MFRVVPSAPRIEIALVPESSPFAGKVRDAARLAGAVYVRAEMATPNDLASRVLVVDLTRALATGRLGSRVIAIGNDLGVDAWEVIPPADVDTRLARAVRNLVEAEALRARVAREQETVEVLNRVGWALTAIPDRERLLEALLTHARRAINADGGSVYLVEDGELRFAAAQNDTIAFRPVRERLPIDETSLAGFVAARRTAINVPDLYALPPDAPYRPDFSFDVSTGYQSRSALLVPLHDRDGQTLGVLALLNRKPVAGAPLASFDRVVPFSERDADIARSIAGQASVALENHRLYREIQGLFEGFVEAAVTAIEARDPSTGGHSWRVAELTRVLAREVNDADDPPFRALRFSEQELTELHYASMLHDFGKVGVREEVLLKPARLQPWEMEQVELRFRLAAVQALLEAVREELGESQLRDRLALLDADLATIQRINHPGTPVAARDAAALRSIASRWHLKGMEEGVLRSRDVERLCIPAGSLDPAERAEIERHVEHTWRFLRAIPWTPGLKNVPELAYAHHEKLDGTGYPRRLRGDEIPVGARLMAVADIFDALTARDRPYRESVAPVRALRVLRAEADAGKLDRDVVALFAGRRLWSRLKGREGQAG